MKKAAHYVLRKGLLFFISSFFYTTFIFSQGIGINETSSEPDPSALLDVSSETKGFLPPRMTTAQRDAIENPAEGLVVYNTTVNCLEWWNGTVWFNGCGNNPPNDAEVLCTGVPTPVNEVTSPTGRIWMDRNLGASQAATSSTDVNAYGDLYQWGRGSDGHQCRTATTTATLSSVDQPGNGNFIVTGTDVPYDWRSPQNTNLWQGVNGVNNPCPTGFRIPTEAELDAERASWSSQDAAGAFASPLKLTLAGGRSEDIGLFAGVGTTGFYWSSTVNSPNSRNLNFNSGAVLINSNVRAYGHSVRCIKD